MSVPLDRNTAGQIVYVSLFDGADIVLTPTIAAGDIQVSLDGGAFNNPTTLPSETPVGGGQVQIPLSQAETNATHIAIRGIDQAGAEWDDFLYSIFTSAATIDTLDTAIANVPDAVHDEVVEGALTLRNIIRILLSFVAGEASGGGTANIAFRNQADTLDRITMTVDANGNRTATAVDGS